VKGRQINGDQSGGESPEKNKCHRISANPVWIAVAAATDHHPTSRRKHESAFKTSHEQLLNLDPPRKDIPDGEKIERKTKKSGSAGPTMVASPGGVSSRKTSTSPNLMTIVLRGVTLPDRRTGATGFS
jgi:hypothetical protein